MAKRKMTEGTKQINSAREVQGISSEQQIAQGT